MEGLTVTVFVDAPHAGACHQAMNDLLMWLVQLQSLKRRCELIIQAPVHARMKLGTGFHPEHRGPLQAAAAAASPLARQLHHRAAYQAAAIQLRMTAGSSSWPSRPQQQEAWGGRRAVHCGAKPCSRAFITSALWCQDYPNALCSCNTSLRGASGAITRESRVGNEGWANISLEKSPLSKQSRPCRSGCSHAAERCSMEVTDNVEMAENVRRQPELAAKLQNARWRPRQRHQATSVCPSFISLCVPTPCCVSSCTSNRPGINWHPNAAYEVGAWFGQCRTVDPASWS